VTARGGRRGAWLGVAAYSALVAYLSLRPFGDAPIERAIDAVGRATLHLPAYAVLAGLLVFALRARKLWRRAALAAALSASFGWLVELAQIPAPTRSFNVRGLLLDAAGAAVGSAAAALIVLWQARRGRRKEAA